MAAGWALSRPASTRRGLAVQAAVFAALGTAPDLDLLIGRHSQETHSLGAALAVASIAAWRRWPIADTRLRIWLTACLVWMTHPVFDGLSVDKGPPIGVLMFWPFSQAFWHLGVDVFGAIERHWQHDGFFQQNIRSVTREMLILVPVLAVVWWARWRRWKRLLN